MDNFSEEIKKEIREEIKNREDEFQNLEKNRKLFRRYLTLFFFLFLILGSYFWGYNQGEKKSSVTREVSPISQVLVENKLPNPAKSVDFSLFWKVWDLLKEKHIEKDSLDAQQLVYGAIDGMLRSTGDPYSEFFDPERSQSFSEDIEGSFEGIGAELGIKDDILTIISPLDDSPAQKAGLRAGDKIIKVDDKIVADLPIDEAVKLIRGKKGTEVRLSILRQGEADTREILVTRDNIEIQNVKVEFKEEGIAYVRIVKFSENVDREFFVAAEKIIENKSRGIVLDLRNNPGGLLDKAVSIASRFMSKGKVVVWEEDSTGKRESLYTSDGNKLGSFPLVILINEGSASASEILAGALRDNLGTILVGKKSFGKGSVQQLIDLPEGSSVKITIAKWLTPNGDYIMEKGITPDIEVNFTEEDYKIGRDPQLDKALEVLKEKI